VYVLVADQPAGEQEDDAGDPGLGCVLQVVTLLTGLTKVHMMREFSRRWTMTEEMCKRGDYSAAGLSLQRQPLGPPWQKDGQCTTDG
jgi:hypothetical protein